MDAIYNEDKDKWLFITAIHSKIHHKIALQDNSRYAAETSIPRLVNDKDNQNIMNSKNSYKVHHANSLFLEISTWKLYVMHQLYITLWKSNENENAR